MASMRECGSSSTRKRSIYAPGSPSSKFATTNFRKARASQTAQSGDFHGPQQFFFRLTQRFSQRLVSSLPNIGFKSSRTAGDDPIQDNSLPAANLDDGSLHFVGGSGSCVAFTQAVEA